MSQVSNGWKRCSRCGDTGYITVFSAFDSYDAECDRCMQWATEPASQPKPLTKSQPAARGAVAKEGTR